MIVNQEIAFSVVFSDGSSAGGSPRPLAVGAAVVDSRSSPVGGVALAELVDGANIQLDRHDGLGHYPVSWLVARYLLLAGSREESTNHRRPMGSTLHNTAPITHDENTIASNLTTNERDCGVIATLKEVCYSILLVVKDEAR